MEGKVLDSLRHGFHISGNAQFWKDERLEEAFFDFLNSFEEPESCVGRHCHEEVTSLRFITLQRLSG